MEMASMFDQYDTGQKIVLDTYRAEYTKNPKDTIESYSQFYDLDQLKQYIAYIDIYWIKHSHLVLYSIEYFP